MNNEYVTLFYNGPDYKTFHGYNQIAIEQDFYSQILLYNMLEEMKQDVEKQINKKR